MVDQSQAPVAPRLASRPPDVEHPARPRRWPLAVTLVLGLGVAFAPVAFQMFSRAPKGGDMINAFRPYMTERKITKFQADMREINAAVVESRQQLRPLLAQRAGLGTAAVDKQYASYADFERQWKSIDDDMSDMLRTMHRDIGDYQAVDALPPFPLFPWFCVAPGLLIAGASTWGLIARRRGGSGRANADSTCGDKKYSALEPGTDGGLTTGAYQAQPDPPFDAAKNGVADKITQPTKFFNVGFALSSNAKDPQTGKSVPEPSITNANAKLSGDLSALNAAWNGQQFNQGAPKPGASPPGNATGTYDAKTGAYTLEWSSPISGGPFNGFTGVWHFEGTFEKK